MKTELRRLAIAGCPVDCDSCVNSETCTRCRPGLYLHSGRCHHVCPEEFEPNDKVMECTAKGRSHRREKGRQDQAVRSDPRTFGTNRKILHCLLRLFPQCIARWASGASGALAPGLVDPVGSNGVRPARGRSFSTHHLLGTPAQRCQRSESVRSRGGNVKVKTQTCSVFFFCLFFLLEHCLSVVTTDPR